MILTDEDRGRIEANFHKILFLLCRENYMEWKYLYEILILDRIEQYIEHRIKSDKVLEGILKDIEHNTNGLSEAIVRINENVGPRKL